MKKLPLKAFGLGEALSREQMKNVTGGGALTCTTQSCAGPEKLCVEPDESCPSGCGYYCAVLCHYQCATV